MQEKIIREIGETIFQTEYCSTCLHKQGIECRKFNEKIIEKSLLEKNLCPRKIEICIKDDVEWIYKASQDNSTRYVLGIKGKKH